MLYSWCGGSSETKPLITAGVKSIKASEGCEWSAHALTTSVEQCEFSGRLVWSFWLVHVKDGVKGMNEWEDIILLILGILYPNTSSYETQSDLELEDSI